MFERVRDMAAGALTSLASRVTTDSRTEYSRVPYSGRTIAGPTITPDTAVTIPAVWACLRYLSQTVAVLPWRVMRETKKGAEKAPSHPLDWLIYKRPNDEWSSFQFRETLVHWALRWGNGYAEIERDQMGRPMALWPLHPERVCLCRDESGALYYEISNGTAGKVDLDATDMFHLRGFGEGPLGVNVMAYAAQSLGWVKAAQIFSASFFGNGGNLAGVVINKKKISLAGLAEQRKEFQKLYGGPGKANKTAFLDSEADYKTIGVDPDKAQFILTQQHLLDEVCRWFGVPPHKIMNLLRGTFSNIEHQSIEVVVNSISPWSKRLEDEADFKLFGRQNRMGFYTKINLNGLMRGDHAARIAFYTGMRNIGCYSPNRVLELEDENTIGPDGDIHTMQSGFTTLDQIGKEPTPPAPPEPAPAPDTQDANEDPAVAAKLADIDRLLNAEPVHVA